MLVRSGGDIRRGSRATAEPTTFESLANQLNAMATQTKAEEPSPSEICAMLGIIALLFGVPLCGVIFCGIGYAVVKGSNCNTQVSADLLTEDYTPFWQPYQYLPLGSDGFRKSGLCSVDVSFTYEGSNYNKSFTEMVNSCKDLHDPSDPDTSLICFRNSPANSEILLISGGASGATTFISRADIRKWRTACLSFVP